jgi:hypothetical protein
MDFISGTKSKNLKLAASKLKAMHVTQNGQFLLDPIRKPPPMTERGSGLAGVVLMKSGSTSMLLNSGKQAANLTSSLGQNKGLISKMIKNFDIDQTGLVST